MCSSVRRHTLSGRYYSKVPRSVKRRSLTVLPDAVVPDCGPEPEDCAFAEQVGDVSTHSACPPLTVPKSRGVHI